MRALSVRQPYAELIMRGEKTVEYRSKPTNIRERVYLYAAKRPGKMEDFEGAGLRRGDLPTGVLHEVQHRVNHLRARRLHQIVHQRSPPGTTGVQVRDRRVQALRNGSDAHLALQHRVGLVEHRVNRMTEVKEGRMRMYKRGLKT